MGAYFHDIGKMLKPEYFAENQARGQQPARVAGPGHEPLVIIAHIKDGADLARQHQLPEPIIDFIEQHHGTTLVDYFYRLANEQSQADPNGAEVDESSFRYPGPAPQTKESAVLMLADVGRKRLPVAARPGPLADRVPGPRNRRAEARRRPVRREQPHAPRAARPSSGASSSR